MDVPWSYHAMGVGFFGVGAVRPWAVDSVVGSGAAPEIKAVKV